MTSSEEMTFALYIDIVSIFHNILRELFQFDFSIDEHLKLLVSYVLNFAIWHGRLHFDFEWNYLFLADLLLFKSFLIFYNLVMLLRSSV